MAEGDVHSMPVKELMTKYVLMVEPEMRVADVMARMLEHNFRCVIVGDRYRELGLVTRFDILEKVVGAGRDPLKVRVVEIMEKPLVYIDAEATVGEAAKLMGANQICNLPVRKNGETVGIIGSSDIFNEYLKRY